MSLSNVQYLLCYFLEDKTFSIRHISTTNFSKETFGASSLQCTMKISAEYDGEPFMAIVVQVDTYICSNKATNFNIF